MKSFRRVVQALLTAGAVSAALASVPALAQPLFTVSEGSVPGSLAQTVTADRISFEYQARIDQTVVGGSLAGAGDTFIEQGFLTKAAFGSPTGGSVPSQLNAAVAGFGYGMYGVFTITGEGDPFGVSGIHATFATLNMTLYIDPNQNTVLSVPGAGPVVPGGITADDYAIVNYTLNTGEAHIFNTLANGDFDTLLNMVLTIPGQSFFTSPVPFFTLENFGGNTETFTITSGDVNTGFTAFAAGGGIELFQTVPEPGSIALLGIGLLAAGMTRRRKSHNVA